MDTCLLIPLYIEENCSPIAEQVTVEFSRNGEIPLLISELTRLEFVAVIARHVRVGTVNKEQANKIINIFERHCSKGFTILPIQAADFHVAQQWLQLLTTPLKSLDSLHLAIAQANNAVLVTADKQLAAAAAMFDIEHYFVSFVSSNPRGQTS